MTSLPDLSPSCYGLLLSPPLAGGADKPLPGPGWGSVVNELISGAQGQESRMCSLIEPHTGGMVLPTAHPAAGDSLRLLQSSLAEDTVTGGTEVALLPLLVTGQAHGVAVDLVTLQVSLHLVHPLGLFILGQRLASVSYWGPEGGSRSRSRRKSGGGSGGTPTLTHS